MPWGEKSPRTISTYKMELQVSYRVCAEISYIILRTNKEETMKRAIERSKLDRDTNIELVQTMWEQFCNLGIYEKNVVDTTNFSISDTVLVVKDKITNKTCLLHK